IVRPGAFNDTELSEISAAVARRFQLRQAKRYADADRLKEAMLGMGLTLQEDRNKLSWAFKVRPSSEAVQNLIELQREIEEDMLHDRS
ncbi:MAG: hypothetical protein AAFQ75_16625, partial [Pseudomonadota bacterium]